ncbi:STAS-like domain-containing protein [Chryseobacterium gleum]|uniref:STAS-like domain-containing protein n=1 Tax=Chryseobacterium gleum TaxID=250 RepID=UPI002899B8F1|nr:STAS-like domain-containing protein [Chryseobacterium gleum]
MFKTCYYRQKGNVIQLTGKINAFNIYDFCSAIEKFKNSGASKLFVDFGRVEKAYPSGMLPIICELDLLRDNQIEINVQLPKKPDVRTLFYSVNWAHYLSPEHFEKSEIIYNKHLVTRRFNNAEEQTKIVDDFMDLILRTMILPKDIISGLEWSINEITDNVLNHSESKFGGLMQATAYPKDNMIAFAVADAGRGILKSMQEGYPELKYDLDAIGEAIKSGVTRNPKFGQGNGLAGSLRVTTFSGGSFDITSGKGRLIVTTNQTIRKPLRYSKFNGTIVCGQVSNSETFSISEALGFDGSRNYIPLDIIDRNYELEDEDCFKLIMKDETTGFGSRRSGMQIRTKVENILNTNNNYPIIIEWSGVPTISSSFADEFIGKLFLKFGAMTFMSRIKNRGMEYLVSGLLDKAIAQRLTQAEDE